MKIVPSNETQLARRAVHNQDAFAELYHCHVSRVYRYFLAHLGDIADAQDLTAQTFLTALESIRGYSGKSSFAVWLLGIARHKMVDHYRRKRNTVPLETAERVPLPTFALDDLIASRLKLEAVRLHIFGALNIVEVAQVMKRSQAASKMLIHRALQDLKTLLLDLDKKD